jgi:2-aminoadipate transaminase
MIRELMKLAGRPGLVSLGGGMPSVESFPTRAVEEACIRALRTSSSTALQYGTTEGLPMLREHIARRLATRGWAVDPTRVLITSGSQQGLDLVGKVLLEHGARVAVEAPTYLGALQAFAPYEALSTAVPCDGDGPLPGELPDDPGLRALYLIPNFQNPTGRCIPEARRAMLATAASGLALPLIEDDPYGDLWFDEAPPPPLASHWPEGTVYLGSLSKVLAPGLRLGFLVAPPSLYPLLVQAKQAADLHSSTFVQTVVREMLRADMLEEHLQAVRARYRQGRDAMESALREHLSGHASWSTPAGGMFFWVQAHTGVDTARLLPAAVERGVSFVPGSAFHCTPGGEDSLRLSFVTETAERIEQGVATLAGLLRSASPN